MKFLKKKPVISLIPLILPDETKIEFIQFLSNNSNSNSRANPI